MSDERAPTGSIGELREMAAENLHLCAYHCSLAVDQFAVLADQGAFYNARRAVAHIRTATDVLKILHERLARQAIIDDENRTEPASGRGRRGEVG